MKVAEIMQKDVFTISKDASIKECGDLLEKHDVNGMPVMDGFETARCLRQQQGGRKATLVALTGWGEEETRRRVKEAGFNRHLTKPADLEQVEALLKAASRNEKSFVVASGRSFHYDGRVRG